MGIIFYPHHLLFLNCEIIKGVKMKLVRLCKDAFFRQYGEFGYIKNQITQNERVYDKIGAIFLKYINRNPKEIEKIVDELYSNFKGVTKEEILKDLKEFIQDLEENQFLVTGESIEELDKKEPKFSYSKDNKNLKKINKKDVLDSAKFLTEYFIKYPTLVDLQMEITGRCNLNCIHCYLPNHPNINLPKNLIFDILDQLKEMGTLSVTFTGGEPLLHNDFASILEKARENDFSIAVLSNGILINKEIIEIFKKFNVGLVQISLYSLNPEIHDKITTIPGSMKKTLKAIESLIEENIQIQISCPVMKENLKTLRDVLNYGESLSVKVNTDLEIMAKTDFSTTNLKSRLNIEEVEEAIKTIIEYDTNYKELLKNGVTDNVENYYYRFKNPDAPICGVGTTMMCLAPNGDFYPCAGFKYIIGNAYKDKVKDVWFNSSGIKFLRSIKNSSYPECSNCEAQLYCARCLSRIYNENSGKLDKIPKFFCEVSHLNKRLAEEFREKLNAS